MLGGDNASGNRLLNNRLADLCQSATRHSGFDSLLVQQSYLDHPDTVAAPLRRDQTAGWFLQLPCGIVHVSPAARTPPCRRCSMHRQLIRARSKVAQYRLMRSNNTIASTSAANLIRCHMCAGGAASSAGARAPQWAGGQAMRHFASVRLMSPEE